MSNDKDIAKIDLFENMPVGKAVLKLSVPTVIGCLVMILYNLADTYFVGLLNNPIENAGVTLAAPVILAFNAVTNLFGVGTGSIMSRALGNKDYETVRRSSAFGFYCALISSVLFSLSVLIFFDPLLNLLGTDSGNILQTTEYLKWTVIFGAVPAIVNVAIGNFVRAEGSVMHATIGTMSGCILNIILDPIFILPFGLNMGAAGAGFATFISNCVACVYFFLFLLIKRGKTFVTINPKYFKPSMYIFKEVFGVGVPASIQNLLNVTGMTVLNNAVSGFGSEAVAAMGISHKITMIPMYISMGIGQGVMPLIGYNFSSGNRARMKSAVKVTIFSGMIFMLAATAAYFFGARGITNLFIDDTLTVTYGTAFVKGMCLAQPFLAFDFLGVAIYQACGNGKVTLIFAILRKIVLEIPAILILNYFIPMYGLAYAQLVAEAILSVGAFFCLRKILNEKRPSE